MDTPVSETLMRGVGSDRMVPPLRVSVTGPTWTVDTYTKDGQENQVLRSPPPPNQVRPSFSRRCPDIGTLGLPPWFTSLPVNPLIHIRLPFLLPV